MKSRYRAAAIIGTACMALSLRAALADPMPRVIPVHDAMGVYRISAPGKPDQTWRIRFQASTERLRAVALSGQAAGVVILLDLRNGAADVVLPQMHAVVDVPGLSALMNRVLDDRGAKFTPLGPGTIAGHACTRYLVLKPDADGTACITHGGVILAARGKDHHGSVAVEAQTIADAPQPPDAFALPQGYSHISLPPQMLGRLLGQ